MKILISNSTKENDIVIDPFVGIGAVAIACKELNRHFICSEIDERYCEIAKGFLTAEDRENSRKEAQSIE
jgi:DNA modification methylase